MNYTAILQQYYLAYYGRAADLGGLNHWLGLIDAQDTEAAKMQVLDVIRASFGSPDQPEFVAVYGADVSDSDFFDRAYRNILNRDADPEGAAYWLGILEVQTAAYLNLGETPADATAKARADVLSLIVNATLAQPEGRDRDTLATQLATAEYITAQTEGLSAEDATAVLVGTKELLADPNIHTRTAAELQAAVDAIVNEVVPPAIPTFTLEEFLALEEPPAEYNLDPTVPFQPDEAVTVETAAEVFPAVVAAIDNAANAAELELGDLFAWDIRDTAANILAAAEEAAVTGATVVSAIDPVTVAEAQALSALPNFDGVYALADTLANLGAAAEGIVEQATGYALTDAPDAFADLPAADALTEAEHALLQGADNRADYLYSIRDTADNLFTNGAVDPELAELLALPDQIIVTTEVSQAQRNALLAINENVEFEGGMQGGAFTFTAAGASLTSTASVNVSPDDQFLSEGDDTIDALNYLDDDTAIEDPSAADQDVLTAVLDTAGARNPTLVNIERIQLSATAEGAELGFGDIQGANRVEVAGAFDLALSGFAQDGGTEARLTTDRVVTLTGADEASPDDVFAVSVEGANGGTFVFAAAGAATDLGAVNLESLGTAANAVTLAVGADYTGIAALNLVGAADLSVNAPFGTGLQVDATGLAGALNLGWVGPGLNDIPRDLSEHVQGDVTVLRLIEYGAGIENLTQTEAIAGLTEVVLDPTVAAADATIQLQVAAGVEVSVVSSAGANALTVVVAGAAADDASDLTLNVGGAAGVATGEVTAAEIQNLSVNSVGMAANALGALATDALETLTVAAQQDFELESLYTTRAGVPGNSDFAVELGGDGAIAFNGLQSGADIVNFTIDANGPGARALGMIDLTDLADGGALLVTGDSAVSFALELGLEAGGLTLGLNSEADLTVAEVAGRIAAGQTVTLNSQSAAGQGENTLADARGLGFDEGSTLAITGNQKLILGAVGTELALTTGADGESVTLDASAFTGAFDLFLARADSGAAADTQVVKLGTGATRIALDSDDTAGSEDTYVFLFAEEGIGAVEIVGFSLDDGLDVLNFSAFFAGEVTFSDMEGATAESTGTVLADGVAVLTVTLGEEGSGAFITAVDDAFAGSIQIIGVSDLADLATGHFSFTGL